MCSHRLKCPRPPPAHPAPAALQARIYALEAELRAANARAASLQRQLELMEGEAVRGGSQARRLALLATTRAALRRLRLEAVVWRCVLQSCPLPPLDRVAWPLAPAADSARLAEAAAAASGKADAQAEAATSSREDAAAAWRAAESLRQQREAANAQVGSQVA